MDRIPIKKPITPDKMQFVDSLSSILDETDLTTGSYTKQVENKLKEIHECRHAVFFSSATVAFDLLVRSYLEENTVHEIHMQDFTWQSTKDVISRYTHMRSLKMKDIDPDKWIWWEDVGEKHLGIPNLSFGNRGSWEEIDHPERLILDASYSFGDTGIPNPKDIGVPEQHDQDFKYLPPESNERTKEPAWGAIMSFSSAKPLTACEGGAVLTDRVGVAEYVREKRRYHGRPSELNALFLLCCMEKDFSEFLPDYSNVYTEYYEELLDDTYEIQKEAEHHTRGEIVCTADIDREGLDEFMQVKQRYAPSGFQKVLKNTAEVYNKSLVLPQGSFKAVKQVSEEINERA